MRRLRSWLLLLASSFLLLLTLAAMAAPKKKGPRKPPRSSAPAKPKGSKKGKPEAATEGDAGAAPATSARTVGGIDAGAAPSNVKEAKQTDAGSSYRFGELEIEGRLKTPQIVYFLRRVRAEFSAQDLGHRSFEGELKETRKEPSF